MAKKTRVMDPKEKALWVRGLLSGKYKQGTGALRTEDGKYCCLGVAQECIAGTKPPAHKAFLRSGRFGLSHDLQVALAEANDGGEDRVSFFKKAGFNTYPGRYGSKASFKTIANWIKKNL